MNIQDPQTRDHTYSKSHSQTPDQTCELSHEGARRKDAIRAAACRATSDRRRGGRFVTSLAAPALPLVLVAAIWSQLPQASDSSRTDLLADGTDATPEDSSRNDTNEAHVVTPNTEHVYQNVQFAVVKSHAVKVETIDDDELLELLARAGRPSGLIRMNGHVQVVEHARADRPNATTPQSAGTPSDAGGA